MPLRSPLLIAIAAGITLSRLVYGQSFQPVGFLNSNVPYSFVNALSGDGSVAVGGALGAGDGLGAFRWDSEHGIQGLPFWEAFGISGDASTVVGYAKSANSNLVAVYWTAQGGLTSLGFLPGGDNSFATAASTDASVIVGVSNSSQAGGTPEIFRWTNETGLVDLGTPSGSQANDLQCFAISPEGSVLVGGAPQSSSGAFMAYQWRTDNGFSWLITTNAFENGAYSVSSNGATILVHGVDASNKIHSFRWSSATGMVEITGGACPPCKNTYAYGISSDGEVIVGSLIDSQHPSGSAAIWTAQQGWRYIGDILANDSGIHEADGWYLADTYTISADGRVMAGAGYDPDGNYQGWIATIPRPAPCPLDTNGDRIVDLSDLAKLLSVFGAVAPGQPYSLACDIDRNGTVDLGDLAALLANFGFVCP